jgi:hypothetical protein
MTTVYAALAVVFGLTLAASQPFIFWTLFIVMTAVFILVALLTKG